MKKIYWIIFTLILSLLCFFIWRTNKHNTLDKLSIDVSKKEFLDKVKESNFDTSQISYYYINVWATSCKPCVEEMPYLDSLSGTLTPNVKCFFVTLQDDKKVNDFLKRKSIIFKHFRLYNNLEHFVNALYNKSNVSKFLYPLHIILNKKLEIVFSSSGSVIGTGELGGGNILLENKLYQLKLLKKTYLMQNLK